MELVEDDKRDLGFTIERGKGKRDSAAVLVSSISRGGPADVEGTLEVGDQVLSVDGQKILGYAYNKVKDSHFNANFISMYITYDIECNQNQFLSIFLSKDVVQWKCYNYNL